MSPSSSAAMASNEDNWRRRNPQPSRKQSSSSSSSILSYSESNSASSKPFHAHQSHPPATTIESYSHSPMVGGGKFGISQGNSQKGFHVGIGSSLKNDRSLELDKGREREREIEREQWRKSAVAAAAGISSGSLNHSGNVTSFSSTSFGSPARSKAMGNSEQSLLPATPLQPLHVGLRTSAPNGVDGATHSENWALTPANSLPSLPGTPSKSHQADFWGQRSHAAATSNVELDPSRGSLRNASPRPAILPSSANASSRNAPARGSAIEVPGGLASNRKSSPKLGNSSPTTFASPTHPSLARVAAIGSPKRSPLSLASSNPNSSFAPINATHSRPAPLSPTSTSLSANKRSLSPATSPLLGSDLAASGASNSNRGSIAYALSAAGSSQAAQGHPAVSRRGSNNSLASIQGHSLTHSRRTSQIYSSAQSVTSNGTSASSMILNYGVYRPPHLRRDSVHALKPAVAHYDRIRTPSLRGQSRSRESSVSVTSRAGSRPPSAVPFNHPNTIPEDGVTEGRPRLGSFGSFLNPNEAGHSQQEILEDEDYFGDQAQSLDRSEGSASSQPNVITPKTADGPDASELEAKLKEAGKKSRYPLQEQEFNSIEAGSHQHQQQHQVARSEMNDDVDLSFEDMMNPSITESYCASRRGSVLGDAVDIFEVGDRLGPGMEHDGHTIRIAETSQGFRDQPEDIGLSGSQLEVVRKLGEGSYAVVYLVREVEALEVTRDRRKENGDQVQEEDDGAFGPPEDSSSASGSVSLPIPGIKGTSAISSTISKTGRSGIEDESFGGTEGDRTVAAEEIYSSTLKASDVPASFSSREKKERSEPREFALKCLCKRDLSPEMLEVQRLEATIHQSIPPHPNIVTLYRTYETPEWLFLIIEYCPGQDLYYWLEQAQDTADTGSASASNSGEESGADESKGEGDEPHGLDATPPSPSLLASVAGQSLLSRRRLRLVASMFAQMCEAVQFCHDRGVSHRDLKPENFIVEDRRYLNEDLTDSDASFTRSESNKSSGGDSKVIVKLTDFGLASAEEKCRDFECGSKPYMAFETLNNITDWYDPFQADTWSLGVVLLNIIFHRSPFSEPSVERCESFAAYCYDHIKFLTESFEGLSESAASFLANNVFCEVNLDSEKRSRITPREFAEWARQLPDHLLASSSSVAHQKVSGGYSEAMTHSLEHSRTNSLASTLPSLLSSPGRRHRELTPYGIEDMDQDSGLSALRSDTPDILPTPSFSPIPPPLKNEEEDDEPKEMLKDEELGNSDERKDPDLPQAIKTSLPHPETSNLEEEEQETLDQGEEREGTNEGSPVQSPEPSETDTDSLRKPLSVTSSNPKRRKRGARKARNAARLEQKQLKRSQSVGQLMSLEEDRTASRRHDRDAVIAELAAASENLAREMSRTNKNRALSSRTSSSSLSSTGAASVALRSSASSPISASPTSARPPYVAPLVPIPALVREKKSFTADSPTSQGNQPHWNQLHSKNSVESSSSGSVPSKSSWDHSQTGSSANSTAPPLSRGQSGEDSNLPSRSASGSKWDSAASRRERMISQRKGPTLQDSGRSQPTSWREKNRSTATLSSVGSTNTASSMGSLSSTGSSTWSTASAPAALPRKSDSSSRHRSRGVVAPTGLGTIDERRKKDVDATYLATVFGGDPRQHPKLGTGSDKFDLSRKRDSSSNLSFVSQTASNASEDTASYPVRKEDLEGPVASTSAGARRQSTSSTASIGMSSNATAVAEEKEPSPPVELSPAASASRRGNPSGLAKFLKSVRSHNPNSNPNV